MIGEDIIPTDICTRGSAGVDLEVGAVARIRSAGCVPAVQFAVRPHHDFRMRYPGVPNCIYKGAGKRVHDVDELSVADEHGHITKMMSYNVLALFAITELVQWRTERALTSEVGVKDSLYHWQWLNASRCADRVGNHRLGQHGRDLTMRSDHQIVVTFRQFEWSDVRVVLTHAAAGQIVHVGTFEGTATVLRDVGIAAGQDQCVRAGIKNVGIEVGSRHPVGVVHIEGHRGETQRIRVVRDLLNVIVRDAEAVKVHI